MLDVAARGPVNGLAVKRPASTSRPGAPGLPHAIQLQLLTTWALGAVVGAICDVDCLGLPTNRSLPAPWSKARSDSHDLVQFRRGHGPFDKTELTCFHHLACSIEQTGHGRAVERGRKANTLDAGRNQPRDRK